MKPTTTLSDTRKSNSMQIRKKYIIISEGYVTERKYFEAISQFLKEQPQVPMAEIVILRRYSLLDGYSDPLRIVRLTDEYLHRLKTGEYSETLFVGKIVESLINTSHRFEKNKAKIARELENVLKNEKLVNFEGLVTDYSKAFDLCESYLRQNYDVKELEPVEDYLPHYEENIDSVCIVVDTDARPTGEYGRFVTECLEKRYEPYITNPKFEFWILLHYDISEIAEDLKNQRIVADIVDSEMAKRKIGKKSDFRPLMPQVGKAIKNSELYEMDWKEIESNTGTNLPILLKKLGFESE